MTLSIILASALVVTSIILVLEIAAQLQISIGRFDRRQAKKLHMRSLAGIGVVYGLIVALIGLRIFVA